MNLIVFIVIGLVAGWLAGKLMKGGGYGIIGDIILGLVGSIIGGYLFHILGFVYRGFAGRLIVAVIGAVILLYVVRLIKKA